MLSLINLANKVKKHMEIFVNTKTLLVSSGLFIIQISSIPAIAQEQALKPVTKIPCPYKQAVTSAPSTPNPSTETGGHQAILTPTPKPISTPTPVSVLSSPSLSTVQSTPTPLPAAARPPVSPPSTGVMSAAGHRPASPERAKFVPQIARDPGGADQIAIVADNKKVADNEKAVDNEKAIPTVQKTVKTPSTAALDAWSQILTHYTSTDANGLVRFDYGALKASSADMTKLKAYISGLAKQKPSMMGRKQAMVYWANLYNALTVQVVAENYPVSSIKKIKSGVRAGPWKRKLVTVEGRVLSLDTIEHGIMRPTFKTPLVHYMVNCASIGCPNLKTTAWSAATLDEDLAAAAQAYINSPRGVKFTGERLQVSGIYKWFKKDFGGHEQGVLAHLLKYAQPELRAKLQNRQKIDKYAYDWNVNGK